MKLKSGLIIRNVGEKQVIVSSTDELCGMIENNETAAFIAELLKNEISEGEIVEKMYEAYDAPREVIERDVATTLAEFKKIGIIE